MKKDKKLIYLCIVFVLLAGVVYQLSYKKNASDELALSENISSSILTSSCSSDGVEVLESFSTKSDQPAQSVVPDTTEKPGCCYVCGYVKKPGVYEISQGERVNDLIEKAGGLKNGAAPECLNLAQAVSDGQKIYVPSVSESEDGGWNQVDGSETVTENGGASEDGKKVNINQADAGELSTLPGIGEAKANSIIAYREEHGSFHNIEEIKNIEGIKDGVFEKLRELIVVQ